MARSVLIFVIGVAVFAVGIQQLFSLRRNAGTARNVASPTPRPSPVRLPSPTAVKHHPPVIVQVTVQGFNFGFAPSTVTVRRGAVVVWVNRTASPHTVTSVVPKQFDAALRGHGQAQLRFERTGEYQYYCALHPYMLGLVRVRGPMPVRHNAPRGT